jgi:ferredoxin
MVEPPESAERLCLGGALAVVVDLGVCIGSGMCTGIAPNVFDLDERGTLVALTTEIAPEDVDAVLDTIDCCPVEAISTAP